MTWVEPPTGYRELADDLRRRIAAGDLAPGARVPSETALMQSYGLARETVRRAIRELRTEGLIELVRGRGAVVRSRQVVEVTAEPGTRVTARMPTETQRREWGIPEGMWAIQVTRPDGLAELYPADSVEVVFPG